MTFLIRLLAGVTAMLMAMSVPAGAQPADQARKVQMEALLKSLHPQTGDVTIAAANARLSLGQDYYFLPAVEAKRVLTEAWGNPPDSVDNVLGMVFPAKSTFMDDSWGAVITYDAMGYVSDKDAGSADYDELLAEMQSGEKERNQALVEQGYPAQHLVGWAQPPVYDARTHSVVWAQNVRFGDLPENTLNYDVRMLGRSGVLSVNMVTGMSKLTETRTAAQRLAHVAAFEPGSRYADFQPGVDSEAGIGIGGLVAAGVGVAAAKKLGLLAIILVFFKKFFVLILAAFAVVGTKFRKLFRGGDEEDHQSSQWSENEVEPAFAAETPNPSEPEGRGP